MSRFLVSLGKPALLSLAQHLEETNGCALRTQCYVKQGTHRKLMLNTNSSKSKIKDR